MDASSLSMLQIKEPQCRTDMNSIVAMSFMKVSLPTHLIKGRKMMLASNTRRATPVKGGSSSVINLITTALPAQMSMTRRPRSMSRCDVIECFR